MVVRWQSLVQAVRRTFRRYTRPVVLCAEDDESLRVLCATALERAGYFVDFAADGRAALEMIRRNQYAAVVLDLGLPFVHGATMLSVISHEHPSLLRKIIVMTGLNDAVLTDVQPLVAAVIRKPFKISRLVDAVRDATTPQTLILPRAAM